jgi:hypothetical protein
MIYYFQTNLARIARNRAVYAPSLRPSGFSRLGRRAPAVPSPAVGLGLFWPGQSRPGSAGERSIPAPKLRRILAGWKRYISLFGPGNNGSHRCIDSVPRGGVYLW